MPGISINTLCLDEAPLARHVDTVARIGARGIVPTRAQIDACGAGEAARIVRDAGIAVAGMSHMAFGFEDADRDRLMRTLELAAGIGAQSVIMTSGGRGELSWPEAADRFVEAVAPCAEAARHAGITLGIEPTSHLYADSSLAHRLADTATLARRAGIAVMIDTFACWTDADLDAAIADAGPLVGIVQVSDYVLGDRGLPCRAVPGDGAVPLQRILPAIVAAGFSGWFDLEIIGPRLHAEGVDAGLRRAIDHVAAILEIER